MLTSSTAMNAVHIRRVQLPVVSTPCRTASKSPQPPFAARCAARRTRCRWRPICLLRGKVAMPEITRSYRPVIVQETSPASLPANWKPPSVMFTSSSCRTKICWLLFFLYQQPAGGRSGRSKLSASLLEKQRVNGGLVMMFFFKHVLNNPVLM